MTIFGSGGRMRAPIDRVLDPRRVELPRGAFRGEGDSGRGRARALPTVPVSIGDFGPILYYHGSDLRIESGVVKWPTRTSVAATLSHTGTAPTISAFATDGRTCVEFADNAMSRLVTPDLSGTLGQIVKNDTINTMEFVFVLEAASEMAATRDLFATLVADPSASAVRLQMLSGRIPQATRFTVAGPDRRNGIALSVGWLRVLHVIVRTSSTSVWMNGEDVTAAVATDTSLLNLDLSVLRIGARDATVGAAPVRLAEFAAYSRELTSAERIAMFGGYLPSIALTIGGAPILIDGEALYL